MKCLNCGKVTTSYLCPDCATKAILGEVFNAIRFYKPEICENIFIREYVESFETPFGASTCIPEILKLFPNTVSEYYYCRYYKTSKDEKFESSALNYIGQPEAMDKKKQTVLYDLLDFYLRNGFVKPRKWCAFIAESDNLCNELVDYIEGYQAEKIDGGHRQKLKIHYNCVGYIEIPNILSLPQPEVLIQTRLGVAISYSQSQKVVNL